MVVERELSGGVEDEDLGVFANYEAYNNNQTHSIITSCNRIKYIIIINIMMHRHCRQPSLAPGNNCPRATTTLNMDSGSPMVVLWLPFGSAMVDLMVTIR